MRGWVEDGRTSAAFSRSLEVRSLNSKSEVGPTFVLGALFTFESL